MTYHFVSEAQLIFKVMATGGRNIQVYFSERDSTGTSTFLTNDDAVANAIMSHSFYKHGRIQLVTAAPEKQEDPKPVVEQQPEIQETVEEPELFENKPAAEANESEEGELTFPNITIAKDYLHRTYNVKKEEIRSMSKIQAFAASKGITIKINAEE